MFHEFSSALLKGEMNDTLSLSLDRTVGFYAVAIIAITVYSSMKTLQSTSISLSCNYGGPTEPLRQNRAADLHGHNP